MDVEQRLLRGPQTHGHGPDQRRPVSEAADGDLWAQGRDPRERRTHTLSQQGLPADPDAQDDELRIEHCRHRGNPESEVEGDALQNLNDGWIPPVSRTENIGPRRQRWPARWRQPGVTADDRCTGDGFLESPHHMGGGVQRVRPHADVAEAGDVEGQEGCRDSYHGIPPQERVRQLRIERNAARTSVEKSSGSSHAAKWPPLSTSL